MLDETSDGEFKLLRIRKLDSDDVDGRGLSLTLQMKIHLQTSALANELWSSVNQILVASDEIQDNAMQKSVAYWKWPHVDM